MPAVIFLNQETLSQLEQRIQALDELSDPLWGKMKPVDMVAHLRRHVEVGLGKCEMKDQSNFLTRGPVRWLVFHSGLPWPKGKVKGPAGMFPDKIGDFKMEKDELLKAMKQFVELASSEPTRQVANPVFGTRSLHYWGRMIGMHFDHHLRQFGV